MTAACTLLLTALLPLPQQESDHYVVEHLQAPEGEYLEVGGMDFSSDGTLWLSTRRGRVWRVEDALAEDPAAARFSIYAEGLHEGLGLKVVDDVVHVVQRGEVSRLLDLDGDGRCDRIETLTQDWGMSGNYHEFAFGLPRDADGNLYVSTNVGFWSPEWWHGLSREPWRGWILRVAPDGTTTPVASGARSPCGLGITPDGLVVYTDNQGDWMPACGIFPVMEGAFYGHPASLRWTDAYGNGERVPSSTEPPAVERTPAAVWIPYEWSRSTGNLEPGPTEGFGPFGGQMFVAELTNGMVLRSELEQVDGVWQGWCIPFRQRVGSVCRVAFAPDGTLFTGFTNRGWGGLGPGAGVARVRYTGATPREILDVKIAPDGFVLRFTEPLPADAEPQVALRAYGYNWWWDYGSPELRSHALEATAELSSDRRTLTLRVPELEPGWCVRGTIAGVDLLHEDFAYTVNRVPGMAPPAEQVARVAPPPPGKEDGEQGWAMMTWQDPFDAWQAEGWELADVALDPQDPRRLLATPGNGALWNPGAQAQGFRSNAEFGDVAFRFRFLLPEGGDSGLYLMDRYELQLVDDPAQCGGVVGVKGPRARGYRGPGDWHEMSGRFYAPRFDADGNKTADARFEAITIDGVQLLASAECPAPTGGAGLPGEAPRGPLRFQGGAGLVALADVRVKPLDGPPEAEGWVPLFDALPEGDVEAPLQATVELPQDYEVRGRLAIAEGGAALLRLSDGGSPVGFAIRIDSTGPGELRTGTLTWADGRLLDAVRTQVIPAGTFFDLRLRCFRWGPGVVLRVWLNEVQVAEYEVRSPAPPGPLLLEPLGKEAGLRVRAMEVRPL